MAERPQPIDRRARGASVEAAARAYLLRAGLRDVAANAAYRGGEIDLVMLDETRLDKTRLDDTRRDGGTLVFIEVRYRRDPRFGGGSASIDAGKRRKLVHAAQAFLQTHREFATVACRFDVIDASGDPERPDLVWLRDAFRADDV